MQSAHWPRPRGRHLPWSAGASQPAGHAGRAETRSASAEPFGVAKPRCLGELRLADLLQAGMINDAEFEAERAALLARL